MTALIIVVLLIGAAYTLIAVARRCDHDYQPTRHPVGGNVCARCGKPERQGGGA